jgi:hypothetical protein
MNVNAHTSFVASVLNAMLAAVKASPNGVTLANMTATLRAQGVALPEPETTEDGKLIDRAAEVVKAIGLISALPVDTDEDGNVHFSLDGERLLESRQKIGFVLAGKEKASKGTGERVAKREEEKKKAVEKGKGELAASLIAAGILVREQLDEDLLRHLLAFEAEQARKAG